MIFILNYRILISKVIQLSVKVVDKSKVQVYTFMKSLFSLLKRLFLSGIIIVFCLTSTYPVPVISPSYVEAAVVQSLGDKIVTKYRFYKGKRQYRRWNDTKNVWVDSHWIDC